MPYTKFHDPWENDPSTDTPISAAALDHIEDGIFDAYAAAENALQETVIDAKGDLIVGTANDTAARTAVGADDEVLAASSAAAGGMLWKKVGNAMIAASADIGLQKLAQEGATLGQAIAWDGTKWAPAAAGAMVHIETKSITAASASIAFTSIPGTYRHLQIIGTVRSADAVVSRVLRLQVNGDTGNNYDHLYYSGHGAFAMVGNQATAQAYWYLGHLTGTTRNYPADFYTMIPNYAGTTFQKSHVTDNTSSENNSNQVGRWSAGGHWANTAAITSLLFSADIGNFISGCTISLYGIS